MSYFLADSTGNIYGLYEGDSVIAQGASQYALQSGSATPQNSYLVSSTVTARPTQSITTTSTSITADGISSCTISGIGTGSVASFQVPVNAQQINNETITDGTIVFTTTFPGAYVINIDLFPYQTFTITITAT